jgi:hypothetical protein
MGSTTPWPYDVVRGPTRVGRRTPSRNEPCRLRGVSNAGACAAGGGPVSAARGLEMRLCFGVYTALLGQLRFGARSRWRRIVGCRSQDSVSERTMPFARCVECWSVRCGWWPGVSGPRPGGSAHLQASDRRPRFIFQSGYVLGCTLRCWASCDSERDPVGGSPSRVGRKTPSRNETSCVLRGV